MTSTSTLTHESVLAAARSRHAAATKAEIDKLQLAVDWAELNPGDPVDETVEWALRPLEVAGDGAPTVCESAIAEFALAIGLKHEAGSRYVGHAVELRHRLPRLWERVLAGQVPVWKARKVAETTMSLPMDAAGHVDQVLAPVAHRCSFAEIERQVEKARAEFDPAEAERRRIAEAEQRRFDVHLRQVTSNGLVRVSGMLDLADALTLDETIAARAAKLDSALPVDVRRSMAAGLLGATEATQKQVVIYTHCRPGQSMVDVENTRSVVTPDQVKEWCQQAGTKVTVRPVLDLNEELATDAYKPTAEQHEQVWAIHPVCVFPRCERPSRGCDLDHRVPWPTGATSTSNLFPLCRTHHRFKTIGGWSYRRTGKTAFEWSTPHGDRHIS